MSTHFDLFIACDLKLDTPQQVIDTLKYMTRSEDYTFENPPSHPFFEYEGWENRLTGNMYRFPGESFATLRSAYRYSLPTIKGSGDVYFYTYSFRLETLDDSLIVYIEFLSWLALYSETSGYIGYWISDGIRDLTPIYFRNGKVHFSEWDQENVFIVTKLKDEPMSNRQNISSGTPWEAVVGYSRAVRVGNIVYTSGTTASDEQGNVQSVGDAYAQTVYIIQKIERALKEAGATLNDVVRTRMFVTDISQWEAIGRAHGEFFKDIRPCSTMVEVKALVDPKHLVEIEVEAIIGAAQ
jgi:enamine deaminase RidA (YjgF/YER057c/UK114 family)